MPIVVDSWPPDVADRLRADGLVPEIKAVPRARAAEQRSAALTSVRETPAFARTITPDASAAAAATTTAGIRIAISR